VIHAEEMVSKIAILPKPQKKHGERVMKPQKKHWERDIKPQKKCQERALILLSK
jgi:hypothetical protein